MKGDKHWYRHELRTLTVQKSFIDKTIDRLIEKVGQIKEMGGEVDEHTKRSLLAAAEDATLLKRKITEIKKELAE